MLFTGEFHPRFEHQSEWYACEPTLSAANSARSMKMALHYACWGTRARALTEFSDPATLRR